MASISSATSGASAASCPSRCTAGPTACGRSAKSANSTISVASGRRVGRRRPFDQHRRRRGRRRWCHDRPARRRARTAPDPRRRARSRGTSRSSRALPRRRPTGCRGQRGDAAGENGADRWGADVQLDRPEHRLGFESSGALGGGEVAGQRDLWRLGRHLANGVSDDQLVTHDLEPAEDSIGSVQHLGQSRARSVAKRRPAPWQRGTRRSDGRARQACLWPATCGPRRRRTATRPPDRDGETRGRTSPG